MECRTGKEVIVLRKKRGKKEIYIHARSAVLPIELKGIIL